MKLSDKILSINLKGITKGLDIHIFGIVEYYVRSEGERMIAL